jgi:hypothetical protein
MSNPITVTALNTKVATLVEQKDFLAMALIRFLDLSGGIDGASCGRGDPRIVRGLAVSALNKAGIAYIDPAVASWPEPAVNSRPE